MNRADKEKAKRGAKLREGLSDEEIRKRDLAESLAKEIHQKMFPEEYDFMMDSISDARDRRRGINPMNSEYTARVNARREELGVTPLGENGMPTDDSSWDVAYAEAVRRLE